MLNKVDLRELNEKIMMLDCFIASMHSLSQPNYNIRLIYFKRMNLIPYYSEKIYENDDYRKQILIWLAEWIRRETHNLSGFALRYLDYEGTCEIII